MEDKRDYIERTQSRAVNYGGKELSPAEMGREFLKLDIDARVDALEQLAADDRPLSISEGAKRSGYVRELRSAHERARRVGR